MSDSLPDSINKTQPISEQVFSDSSIPILQMDDPDFPVKLCETFKNIGFVIIENHGIEKELIDRAFQTSREVFKLPEELKKPKDAKSKDIRGYSAVGKQILGESINDEKKQTFDLGHPSQPGELQYYPDNEAFIKCSAQFYEKMFEAYVKLMVALQQGLHLQAGTITKKCCSQVYNQTMRYLFYPQVSYQTLKKMGEIRCGAHSDYGTVTLLFQKPGFGQDGLQALNSKQQWTKVCPPDYCMVVNLGDLFQHWTNDQLLSTIHRVAVDQKVLEKLEKGELEKAPQRQSIVLFCDPDDGEIFEILPGFGEPKYQPFNGKQYVYGRVKKTYNHNQS